MRVIQLALIAFAIRVISLGPSAAAQSEAPTDPLAPSR
jgi:hypothetical protein